MAPPSLPQPLGRIPGGRLAGHSDHPDHLDHSPQSDVFCLPATPASVGAARRKVRELLEGWGVGSDASDNALLVTSELVTNALTHADGERIVCRLRLAAGRLHLEVEDENRGGGLPAQRRPGPDEQCGRGLLLVEFLTGDWGVRDAPDGSGRVVWAELLTEQAELQAEERQPEPGDPTSPASPVPRAAPAPRHPSASHRTRPVPHSAEGVPSHGPSGSPVPHSPHSQQSSPYSRP
ncbi:ATP-binding protein [Streptomyces graminilatus]|uniref:ATP-binding protein n=1 Tax=Streptomyces graminilatus TaxID=1464070 RepID=UPI0006E44C1B|nr:ATP-binding protein [Streptomyces graminilatus]